MNNYSMRRKINRFLNLHIKKHKELITIFLSITSILYVGLRLFYNEYFFQPKCEEYYGIPGKYFSTNINFKIVTIIIVFAYILLILYFPIRIKQIMNKSRKSNQETKYNKSWTFMFVMGLITTLVLITISQMSIEYMVNYRYTDRLSICFFSFLAKNINIIFFLICLSSLCIAIFFYGNLKIINKIKYNLIKKIFLDILIIVMFIDLIIISYGTTIKFLSSIDQKKDYEFITVNQKDYVILSEYDGKYLVTPYVNDNGAYTFYTINMNLLK